MRPRALTSVQSSSTSHLEGTQSKHSRANSELPGPVTRRSASQYPESKSPRTQTAPRLSENQSWPCNSPIPSPDPVPSRKDLPTTKGVLYDNDSNARSSALDETVTASSPKHNPQSPTSQPTPASIANSFLKMGKDLADPLAEVEVKQRPIKGAQTKELGLTFDDLVERLLSQPISKSDGKFAAIFLCLYRKFAAPSELLSAVIQRFHVLNESSHPQILRTTSQLRYLSILAQWVSDYPGDFAHAQTRYIMSNFVINLAGNRAFAVAGNEIASHLEIVAEDDDTEWACSDESRSRANTVENLLSTASVQSVALTPNADSSSEDVTGIPKKHVSQHSSAASVTSNTNGSKNQLTGSFQTLLITVENAQRQAQLLTPIPRNPLTKMQWHQLMDIPEEDVARELTRIDWIMFSSIRPRDLIRHVSLAGHEKNKCKNLENVDRMIDQFNHVAFWVANFIVLRDKPKHRARMLEKFMAIAWVSYV